MTASLEQGTSGLYHNPATMEQRTAAWVAFVNGMNRHSESLLERGFSDRDEVISIVLEDASRSIDESLQDEWSVPEARMHRIAELLSCVPQPADSMRSLVERCVDTAFAARAIEEATWPPVTDCDRLDQVFEVLEGQDILVRQVDCPGSEYFAMTAEAEVLYQDGVEVRGYAFYNEDDVVEAMEGNGVSLKVASLTAEDDEQICQAIIEALEVAGFHPLWSGSLYEPINVPLKWRRRVASQPDYSRNRLSAEARARAGFRGVDA